MPGAVVPAAHVFASIPFVLPEPVFEGDSEPPATPWSLPALPVTLVVVVASTKAHAGDASVVSTRSEVRTGFSHQQRACRSAVADTLPKRCASCARACARHAAQLACRERQAGFAS